MVISWRDHLLKEFPTAGAPALSLVADPDGLLLEAGVAEGLAAAGYEVLTYDDPLAFRLRWEDRKAAEVLARPVPTPWVIRTAAASLEQLPFELLRAGRTLRFGLAELFPALTPGVVSALGLAELDTLFTAVHRLRPGELGERKSREFVLQQVFGIRVDAIAGPAELLHALLRRHFHGQRVPRELDAHLIRRLRARPEFRDWPLEQIVPHRDALLEFLQERWLVYLDWQTELPWPRYATCEARGTGRDPGNPYPEATMVDASVIVEHMEVIGSDGEHVGTVDHVDNGNFIKLTRRDVAAGGEHHWIPVEWVATVKGSVQLDRPADRVREEWSTLGPFKS